MMFTGMTHEVTVDFERLGYSIPEQYNPADWILDVAQGESMEMLESHGFFPEQNSESSKDIASYKDFDRRSSMKREVHKTSWCVELEMLLERERNSLIRSPAPLIANVVITAFLSVVFGVIFFGVGRDNRNSMLVSYHDADRSPCT